MLQSSPKKKVFNQREEKLPVALYMLSERYPQATTQFRDLTGDIICGKDYIMAVCFTFCNAGTDPLPNKRVNMGIPQLLSREEKYPKVKNTLLQRTQAALFTVLFHILSA